MDILVPDTKIQTARSLEEASVRAASPITFSAVEAGIPHIGSLQAQWAAQTR